MAAPTTVGIIANPASGKDIRRLVAYGTVFDNQEKVNIVRRVLLALSGTGVGRVLRGFKQKPKTRSQRRQDCPFPAEWTGRRFTIVDTSN